MVDLMGEYVQVVANMFLKIYSTTFAEGFNDVINGTNPGCGTLGFNATKGWDPVTGLGTPNFPSLLSKWLAL